MPVIPFQLLTWVRLMTPKAPPPASPEDDEIFAGHLRYLRGLVDQGVILANGPAQQIDDPLLRGISLYQVGPDEARRLASEDPAVKAGWFELKVDQWMIPVNPRTIADRTDVEHDVPF